MVNLINTDVITLEDIYTGLLQGRAWHVAAYDEVVALADYSATYLDRLAHHSAAIAAYDYRLEGFYPF